MKEKIIQSIKGKIILVGVLSIIACLVIGNLGIASVNKTSKNSDIAKKASDIAYAQMQNKANDAYYQYYVDEKYIDNILANQQSMLELANEIKKSSGLEYSSVAQELMSEVETSKENYSQLVELLKSRGFNTQTGVYTAFSEENIQALKDSLNALVNVSDWVEIKWIETDIGQGDEEVTVNGKDYIKVVYDNELPKSGKRTNLVFRVGGTFTYDQSYYVTNIKLVNGSDVCPIEVVDIANAAGEATKNCEATTFNGQSAFKVDVNFNAANGSWEETQIYIPIEDYELQDYPVLQYDIYFEKPSESFGYKYGGAVTGVYGFAINIDNLTSMVDAYTEHVLEGADVTEEASSILGLIEEIATNIPKYTTDPALAEDSSTKFEAFATAFTKMTDYDQQILALKAKNIEVSNSLDTSCQQIQELTSKNMNSVKAGTYALIVAIIAIFGVGLFIFTGLVIRRISKNVSNFQNSLKDIADGNIVVRADQSRADEFAVFGKSINGFMDRLQVTIEEIKNMSNVLSDTGTDLDERASKTKNASSIVADAFSDIAKGAAEQANDIEQSNSQIAMISEYLAEIIESVNQLSKSFQDMHQKGKEASSIMENLSKANSRTTDSFVNISNQINKTNDSVLKIQEAVDLIASIASQTNLLSLNASIEAARAGEAGRGFAVVASEIQKLAEQTNSSAGIINQIIMTLSDESKQTVEAINEVTELIEDQQKKIEITKEKFTSVNDGIETTTAEIRTVLDQATKCDGAGKNAADLMTDLSAIAEENAAATEQTTSSVHELYDATAALSNQAEELMKLSNQLNKDLGYFKV